MRRITSVLVALAITLAAACGGDSTTQPTASFEGSWSLQTINGSALPFVAAQNGQDKLEVLSDVFTTASGKFTEATTLRSTVSGQTTTNVVPDSGTYAVSGSTVTFTFSDTSYATGTVSGSTMTMSESGYSFVYRKQ